MGLGTSSLARAEALLPQALESRYATRARVSFAVKLALLLWAWAALDAAAHYAEERDGLRQPPPVLSFVRALVPAEVVGALRAHVFVEVGAPHSTAAHSAGAASEVGGGGGGASGQLPAP